MKNKIQNKIVFELINVVPLVGVSSLVEEPSQVFPVAILLSLPLKFTVLNPVAANLVKVMAELVKALVILQVIVPVPPSEETTGIEQVTVGLVGALKVGVHVVTDVVFFVTVPVTVKV
jgi:hypothetical protein